MKRYKQITSRNTIGFLFTLSLFFIVPLVVFAQEIPEIEVPNSSNTVRMIPTNCDQLRGEDLTLAQSNGLCITPASGVTTNAESAYPGDCGTANFAIYDSGSSPGGAWYSISLNSSKGAMTWISWNINWNNLTTGGSGFIPGGKSVYFGTSYATTDLYYPEAGDNIATLTGSVAILGGKVWCTILPIGDETQVT